MSGVSKNPLRSVKSSDFIEGMAVTSGIPGGFKHEGVGSCTIRGMDCYCLSIMDRGIGKRYCGLINIDGLVEVVHRVFRSVTASVLALLISRDDGLEWKCAELHATHTQTPTPEGTERT
jgi:hypothetical protein